MNILIIDTETTSEKRFCYDLGWLVYDTTTQKVLKERQYLINEVWNNTMLFSLAYYFDKKDMYKEKQVKEIAWNTAMLILSNDIKNYKIENVYAYNIAFDLSVFENNCGWFSFNNPIEKLNAFDIWSYATNFIVKDKYIQWCLAHEKTTENDFIKTNAETIYQYITKQKDFIEKHNGLDDAKIELDILLHCINDLGASWNFQYHNKRFINSPTIKDLEIIIDEKVVATYKYINKVIRNGKVYLKQK
jgi:hypothetical protein